MSANERQELYRVGGFLIDPDGDPCRIVAIEADEFTPTHGRILRLDVGLVREFVAFEKYRFPTEAELALIRLQDPGVGVTLPDGSRIRFGSAPLHEAMYSTLMMPSQEVMAKFLMPGLAPRPKRRREKKGRRRR